jgi:ABC-2 type transport system ATP-binding protein
MADRVGVITRGELILVEDKAALMNKLGGKQLTLQLAAPLAEIPPALARYGLTLGKGGGTLVYRYEAETEDNAIADLLQDLAAAGIAFADLHTTQRSLEEIFVSLVSEREPAGEGAR